ncbi:MAG: YicC family protein [Burkholderiaceae bacterium]|nr:MAG: YicC family protein [Burkholderiaceae bacterium]TAM09950.1 MAG: YicC family protein [Pusillimonas sp.]
MIRSMTAFGAARVESPEGTLAIELRSVNSRFLDINFRLPDELRALEGLVREKLSQVLARGKVDIRMNYTRIKDDTLQALDEKYLSAVAEQLKAVRRQIPDAAAPTLGELLKNSGGADDTMNPELWATMCTQATSLALNDFQANREREGERLAQSMLTSATSIAQIVSEVGHALPQLLEDHRQKLSTKLRDTLQSACPEGFAQISGAEFSARIAQETSLFSLRIDVAEELARLGSHVDELQLLLAAGETSTGAAKAQPAKSKPGSVGKRLDFLFQEMNREANTLGSKAGNLSVTRAAIDLKLLIEQLREQAQNIE